jgi:hypothetical protein
MKPISIHINHVLEYCVFKLEVLNADLANAKSLVAKPKTPSFLYHLTPFWMCKPHRTKWSLSMDVIEIEEYIRAMSKVQNHAKYLKNFGGDQCIEFDVRNNFGHNIAEYIVKEYGL